MCRRPSTATTTCTGATGVEMEALTAVSVAALTVYDMRKAAQKDMVIDNIRLAAGKPAEVRGFYQRGAGIMEWTAAVITVSDKGSRGERVETSGPALVEMLSEAGYQVVYTKIIPERRLPDCLGAAPLQRRA